MASGLAFAVSDVSARYSMVKTKYIAIYGMYILRYTHLRCFGAPGGAGVGAKTLDNVFQKSSLEHYLIMCLISVKNQCTVLKKTIYYFAREWGL